MLLLTLGLCVVIVNTEAQFLGSDLLQQIPVVSNLPLLNSPIGQQFLQGLQRLSSFQQGHGSGSQLQDFNGPPQQNFGSQSNFNYGPPQLNSLPGRTAFGGQHGGLQQSGFGGSHQSAGSQQSNERPGFNAHPPPPFGGHQQRLGFGNNQQQQGFNRPPSPQQQIGVPQQQQTLVQQSVYGGAQPQGYTASVQDYSYNLEQNNLGRYPSSSNYENILSNEDQGHQVQYQQNNIFYHFGNSDEQEDPYDEDINHNQNVDYQQYNTFYQFGNSGEIEDYTNPEEYEEHERDVL